MVGYLSLRNGRIRFDGKQGVSGGTLVLFLHLCKIVNLLCRSRCISSVLGGLLPTRFRMLPLRDAYSSETSHR